MENSAEIKPINKETIHRICSGQVVLSLSIAVKELVENALDAGSTIISVKLKEFGLDLVEVEDNGCGVLPENFQFLTLKHFTSKLKEYSDLTNVKTLGFRGEALSSLCALSDVTIVTRHSSAVGGSRISYDKNGQITKEVPVAREVGTSVSLSSLFLYLPVRRKEFEKNLKREFKKMEHLLQAYCLVSKKVKFSCFNTPRNGSKNKFLSTDGNESVRENIINIFGVKQISSLLDVKVLLPDSESCEEFAISEVETLQFNFDFIISNVAHGSGRSANDRQFFFVNSRPCEPNKLMKLINETYKIYNSNQFPFVYLNILAESHLFDVNITPDKRQVFIEKEKILLATIKTSLKKLFKQQLPKLTINNVPITNFILTQTKDSITSKRTLTETNSISPLNKRLKLETVVQEKQEVLSQKVTTFDFDRKSGLIHRKATSCSITLQKIKEKLLKKDQLTEEPLKVKFHAEISSESNKLAEQELNLQLSKTDFSEMTIIGQFNLGFIIVKLQNDLFIVDQHATDEKYNFEQLQLNTQIKQQTLVSPLNLQLSSGNQALLLDKIEVFKKNGFSFKIEEENGSKKVFLSAVPISKNFVFRKEDILEMLFSLESGYQEVIRPSRIRAMLASRACRKSVMIGTALKKNDMRKLIDNMGKIEQPWNCPHGRPTIRHLINLDQIKID